MRKFIALLFVLGLTLCPLLTASADTVNVNVVDLLYDIVKEYLDGEGYTYEFDNEHQAFTMSFGLDCTLSTADVTIYLYDDMVSVSVDSPLQIKESLFENAAIFTTLANNEMYYAQFRIDRDSGFLTCRSCQIIETVLPESQEIDTLLLAPLYYMEAYGEGIAKVSTGGNPYDAFEACLAQ